MLRTTGVNEETYVEYGVQALLLGTSCMAPFPRKTTHLELANKSVEDDQMCYYRASGYRKQCEQASEVSVNASYLLCLACLTKMNGYNDTIKCLRIQIQDSPSGYYDEPGGASWRKLSENPISTQRTKYRVLHEHLVAGAEDANDGGRQLGLRKQIIFEQFLVK